MALVMWMETAIKTFWLAPSVTIVRGCDGFEGGRAYLFYGDLTTGMIAALSMGCDGQNTTEHVIIP